MDPAVINVVPTDNYTLLIDFDNGEQAVLDMKPYLTFGVFKNLQNPTLFKQVRVVFDTVEWPSGIDIDPEFVYANCQKKMFVRLESPLANSV